MSHENDILRANFTIQANCPMESESKERHLNPLANEENSQLSQKPELFAGANFCVINIQSLVAPCLRKSKRSTNSLKRHRHFQSSDEEDLYTISVKREATFFFLMQLYLQFQHLHYTYTFITLTFTLTIYLVILLLILTLPIHALLYNTMLKDKEWKSYQTTYNTILMLLRTILILQYDCLIIDIIND